MTGLDFDGFQADAVIQQEIHFQSLTVAPEIQVGLFALVESALDALSHYQVFEKRSPLGVEGQLFPLPDAQKPGDQAGIKKIELRGFNEPLVEVIEMGAEQEDDVTRLQD